MQKIILFIEHTDYAFFTPETIGNLFINRFAIDEDDSSEILNIYEFVEVKRSIYNDYEKGLEYFIVRKIYRFDVRFFGLNLSSKEKTDLETIDDGIKCISDFGKDDLKPHLIYCGWYYSDDFYGANRLKEMIWMKMFKFGIRSLVLTTLNMRRSKLVTNEKVKKAYKGELQKHYSSWEEGSINDDLEKFIINLQNKNEMKEEFVSSFFTPKLKNEEMKLIRDRNLKHLMTYEFYDDGMNPDVDVEEMKKSDSKSKYVHVNCERTTIHLDINAIGIKNRKQNKKCCKML